MTYNQKDMFYYQKQEQPLYNEYNNCVNKTFNHSRFCKNEPKQPESNWRCGILTFKNNTKNKNGYKILYKCKLQYNKTSNEICTNWNNKWDSDNLFGWKNTRLL